MLINPYIFGYTPTDANAAAYIAAVEAADSVALEPAVRKAIDQFVIGCKADGIWNAIKASCILAGAQTLNGALVPLVGTAPTNNNFISSDYNRKSGLKRNGNTKYLNSNRQQSADGQNDHHLAIYKSDAINESAYWIGSSNGTSFTLIGRDYFYSRSLDGNDNYLHSQYFTAPAGFYALSRSGSTTTTYKRPDTNVLTSTIASQSATVNINHYVGAYNNNGSLAGNVSTSSFAFYSIGSSLSISLLDSRVTTLISAIAAAIP